jgi:hypothetical protein
MDPERSIFQKKRTDEYFCVSVNVKALYLVYGEGIPVLKGYNIARLYNSKHNEKYKNEKVEVVVELNDENWLLDLTLLCNMSHHKLQGQQKLISDMFEAARDF